MKTALEQYVARCQAAVDACEEDTAEHAVRMVEELDGILADEDADIEEALWLSSHRAMVKMMDALRAEGWM